MTHEWILLRGSEIYDLKIWLKSEQTNLGILREVLRTKIRDENQDGNFIVVGGCPGRGGYSLA